MIKKLHPLLLLLIFVISPKVNAQATPNPCGFPNVTCNENVRNGIVNSFGSSTINYASAGRSMPFWFAIGDTVTNAIDTTTNAIFHMFLISGPGEINGIKFTGQNTHEYYDSIVFNFPGTYYLQVNEGFSKLLDTLTFIVPSEVSFCSQVPGGDCDSVKGNQIFAFRQSSTIIPVDAVLPITVGVIDSASGLLDTAFVGTIYAELANGPGVLYGSLSMTGIRWFNFTNLRFSEEGFYTVRFYEENESKYADALVDVEVIEFSSGIQVVTLNGFKAYPNPINNQFIISSKSDLNGSLIEIFSDSGKRFLSKKINDFGNEYLMNTTDLKQGVYLVRISTENTIHSIFKIVK